MYCNACLPPVPEVLFIEPLLERLPAQLVHDSSSLLIVSCHVHLLHVLSHPTAQHFHHIFTVQQADGFLVLPVQSYFALHHYTVPRVINFPRYNTKCSGEFETLRGIFLLVSCFPVHFMSDLGNLDYFLDSGLPLPPAQTYFFS